MPTFCPNLEGGQFERLVSTSTELKGSKLSEAVAVSLSVASDVQHAEADETAHSRAVAAASPLSAIRCPGWPTVAKSTSAR
ncbi:hypothetical protein PG984_006786 [Apiospora sp. TS-2023a]